MKFDLTTFLFQIINFVVLLFVLKRLLYRPVREIIEKRRALIEKTVEDAEEKRKEALALKDEYQKGMTQLKELRQHSLEKLEEEVLGEKKRMLAAAEEEAARVKEREKVVFDAEKKRLQAELKGEAIDTACVMASSLFKDLADEELHRAVYGRLLEGLEEIVADLLAAAGKDDPLRIELASAYPLGEEELKRFRATLEPLCSRKVVAAASLDKDLIAGARMKAYDRVYNFSLAGQVALFKKRLQETV